MMGKGRGPAGGVDPMYGARDRAAGWDLVQAITEMVKQSHPGGSEELLGVRFGVCPEKCPSLHGFGGDPDDGVVLGPQM